MAEILITDSNYAEHLCPVINGTVRAAHGLIPRDYSKYPVGYLACAPAAVDMPLIPRSEWSERIKEMEATKSRLSDIMLAAGVPCLDQGPVGYCWAHSAVAAVMALRAVANQATIPLSAYAVAATIKQGRDEGGWGAQALDFISSRGVPSQALWPQGDRDYRSRDKPEVWNNAALHKVTEGWVDLQAAQYDRELSFDQVATCLLCRIPVIGDFNWWGHSVLVCDLVETSPGQFGVRIRNSWGNGWGEQGFGVLSGSKAIPDGATAPRVTLPSAA